MSAQHDALLSALPFLEDMESCSECRRCYKPGRLKEAIRKVRSAAVAADYTSRAVDLLRRIRAADEAALTELLKMNIPTDSLDYGFRKEIAELLREIDRA